MGTTNSNIPVVAKSTVYLPDLEIGTLFFDSENSNHLTSVINLGGVKTFHDYAGVVNGFNQQTVQTVGATSGDVIITIPEGYLSIADEHKITGLNTAGTLGYGSILQSVKSPTGATAQNVAVLANDFVGATVVLTYPTTTTIKITFTGIAGQTINWKVSTNLSSQNLTA